MATAEQTNHRAHWKQIMAALRRDWLQTRFDLGIGGVDFAQSYGDTLRQLASVDRSRAGRGRVAEAPAHATTNRVRNHPRPAYGT